VRKYFRFRLQQEYHDELGVFAGVLTILWDASTLRDLQSPSMLA
jgi:hypothetical protein